MKFKVFRLTHKNGIEVNFTSILMSVFWLQRAEFQRTWLFASNAHAYRLYIFKDRSREFLLYFRLTAISEVLYSSTTFAALSTLFAFSSLPCSAGERRKRPALAGRFGCKSLTMTYFHTGTRTIIGADAFHCPVRDGKEWYHVAMVIRHNLLLC